VPEARPALRQPADSSQLHGALGQLLHDVSAGLHGTRRQRPEPQRRTQTQPRPSVAVPISAEGARLRSIHDTNATLERVREGNIVMGREHSWERVS